MQPGAIWLHSDAIKHHMSGLKMGFTMRRSIFSKETELAISSTIDYVAIDSHQSGGKATLAELALDAGRLTSLGYPEADNEVRRLIEERGWIRVVNAASKL